MERKKTFDEDGVILEFFLTWVIIISDKMDYFHKAFAIVIKQEGHGVKITPQTQVVTPSPTNLIVSSTTKASLVTHGRGKPSSINVDVNLKDQTWSPPINTKRDMDQDKSPLLEEDSPKHAQLSRDGGLGSTTSLLKVSTLFHAQIPHTPLEATASMSEVDILYLQNIPNEGNVGTFLGSHFLHLSGCFFIIFVRCWLGGCSGHGKSFQRYGYLEG
ncbi:unnamed protein product [Vicia faba]|uniref:Uncharacterized protein n=1 Tax=Vicia faba TaxID=3906 RepID=A0AAV0YM16_VICFA|nr:unnamed protein product [Vicia faba]